MSHPNPLGSNPPIPPTPWCTCGCGGDPILKAKIAAERKAHGGAAVASEHEGGQEQADGDADEVSEYEQAEGSMPSSTS